MSRRALLVCAVVIAAVAFALVLSLARVPADGALALRRAGADTARLVVSGWALAPPGLVQRERLKHTGDRATVDGSFEASTREGVSATVEWHADLVGPSVPSGPDGVAARLQADLAPLIGEELARRPAAEQGDEDLRGPLVARYPAWQAALQTLTVHVTLPESARRAAQLGALRGRVPATGRRVALIGWDGADWELLDRLVAAGRMPNLERLLARGASARLGALKPLISPLIWTSIATGVTADAHGIFDFLRPSAEGSGTEPITSYDRKAPALWNIASALGRPVGVVAWWASWPAEPVEGFVISDRVAYQLSGYTSGREQEGLFYPADAASWLLPLRRDESDVTDAEIARYIDAPAGALAAGLAAGHGFEDPVVHLARVLASTDTYHRMTLAAWQRFRPELLFTYVEGTDTIGHLFGPYTPPRSTHIADADVRRFGRAVDAYYSYADTQLGELLAALGADTTVLVCSDHGFTWGGDRPRESSSTHTPTAAWWHRPEGVLLLAGPGIRHVPRRGGAHVLDIGPTVAALAGLPPGEGWTGQVLGWALEPNVVPASVRVDWPALLPPAVRSEAAKDDPNAREYLARLKALGYIAESAETGGAPAAQPTPAETLSAVMNRGTVLLDRGDVAGALAEYRRASELSPGVPGPWLKLAVAQRRAGRKAEALESYRSALAVARDATHRESAYLGQGVMLAELGRPQEAIAVLQAGVRDRPDSFILWNTLGGVHLQLREREHARAAFEQATALREDPDALNSLAALELALGGDPAKARRLWQRSLELRPGQQDVERALRELQR